MINQALTLRHKASLELQRGGDVEKLGSLDGLVDATKLKGRYVVEHYNKDGEFLGKYDVLNDIVNQGKNDLFDIMFNDGTQVANSAWVISLISLAGYSALSNADTMASHAGWTEFTDYTQSTRVAWGSDAAASQSVSNSSPATFDINASGTVKGIFVCTQNTKGGTSGRLWSTALFSADVPVSNGDQLRVTYTVSA